MELAPSTATKDLKASLKHYFGFNKFKGHQEKIIQSVLAGKDTFVIMPTGGGKSLCYQLPALLMDGIAIVISPLIALMKNQVDSIRSHSESDEVAHFLNSSLSRAQMKTVKKDIVDGKTKLLFIAPETLSKQENIDFFAENNISFVAVDEAHCISEWGHDFRPDYRNIRTMIDNVSQDIPVVALTATATPKVQLDIVKNLNMKDEDVFISSFNRDNLQYEIRPKGKKEKTIFDIVKIVKEMPGQSGIIYVQSRKSTEEISQILNVNGVKAAPYHAGLDAKTRSATQDAFLMEDVDVIVATIAFGMGIDKPDVRFVIHYNIPKSIENYYQETGRAGRDGLDGRCVAFYSYKDIQKLEKFLRDKHVSERETGAQLLQEVMAYSETTACRRQFLLHYFGEDFDQEDCNDKCDNCKHPKKRIEVQDEMTIALQVVVQLDQLFKIDLLVDFVLGNETKQIKDYNFHQRSLFGKGKEKDKIFWSSVFRQGLLNNLLYKDVETYGLLKLTAKGQDFIKNPQSIEIPINNDFENSEAAVVETSTKSTTLDTTLLKMLKDLTRRVAKEKKVPPFVVFQEPSLIDMATNYPITIEELSKVSGVSEGKAKKYGAPFLDIIQEYVEENEIDRPSDFVYKQVANKSIVKVNIIKAIDRKIPLHDIAASHRLKMNELMDELDAIVVSGTSVNLDYYIEDNVDPYSLEDTYDYFMQAETDDVDAAFNELKEEDVTYEEIQLVRLKFLSEMANK